MGLAGITPFPAPALTITCRRTVRYCVDSSQARSLRVVKFFQSSTPFLKGDVENLSIDSHGQLTLGPVTSSCSRRRRRFCGR